MPRWYSTIEAVKSAGPAVNTPDYDALLGSYIEAVSQDIEQEMRVFIPETATKYFNAEEPSVCEGTLYLDGQHLIAVTELKTRAQDASPVTIAPTDYFLEPVNDGPPYSRIELKRSSSAAWEAGTTPQRAIAVTGRWGHWERTRPAGTLAAACDADDTSLQVSEASLVGVGDTMHIDDEQIFISGRGPQPTIVTVERGVNGTTAATHTQGDVITVHVPPADIADLCRAEAIARHQQGRSGWTGQIGGSDGVLETRQFVLRDMWRKAKRNYPQVVAA